MKKFGMLMVLVGALGTAVLGCEPAKKKAEPPKAAEPAAEMKPADAAAAPPADAPK